MAKNIPLRKRDLVVIKIVDWSDDKPDCEPAIDVEVYINGEFKIEKSKVFPIRDGGDRYCDAIEKAEKFAKSAIMNRW